MSKKRIATSLVALAAAFALVLGAVQPGGLLAYFTTYARAEGSVTLQLHHDEEIHEEFDSWTKRITVTSDAGAVPVFVRAKGFAGSQFKLEYSADPAGSWVEGPDKYWYYTQILNAGQTTSELDVKISGGLADMKKVKNGETFDVVVVYESTPVVFTLDDSGNSVPATAFNDKATWTRKVDVNTITP